MADWKIALTWTIFALTYGGLALGRIPGLRTDRAGIALVGATLLLVTGTVRLDEAISPASIDYKTLLLLFGMMIVVGSLRLSGFFERLTNLGAAAHHHAWRNAGRDHRPVGSAIGIFDQRRRLRRHDAAGGARCPAVEIRSPAPSDRIGDGGQHRLDRHDHGKSAKHLHRCPLGHLVSCLCRPADACGTCRAGDRLRRGGGGLSRAVDGSREAAARRCDAGR